MGTASERGAGPSDNPSENIEEALGAFVERFIATLEAEGLPPRLAKDPAQIHPADNQLVLLSDFTARRSGYLAIETTVAEISPHLRVHSEGHAYDPVELRLATGTALATRFDSIIEPVLQALHGENTRVTRTRVRLVHGRILTPGSLGPRRSAKLGDARLTFSIGLDRQRAKEASSPTNRSAVVRAEAKAELLNSLSHRLRTPMSGILGCAELLADMPLSEDQEEMRRTILRSASMLLEVVNEVLEYPKITQGQIELVETDFSLGALLKQTADDCRAVAKASNVVLRTRLSPDLPRVKGDSGRIRQIVSYLIYHGVRHSPGGEVTVHAQVHDQAASPPMYEVKVRDTGVGISGTPSTEQPVGREAEPGGAGLGLSLCQQLASLMGGKVSTTHDPGEGSTTSFHVGLATSSKSSVLPDKAPSDPRTNPMRPVRGMRILVAEDDSINQLVVAKMLRSMGVDCDFADNGAAAVKMATRDEYDAILMDLQMPVMDGHRAAQLITAELAKRGETIPIIALTATVAEDDPDRGRESGFADFLAKPVSRNRLRLALSSCLPKPEVATAS